MTTQIQTASLGAIHGGAFAGNQGPLDSFIAPVARLYILLGTWNERARQRHALGGLDARLLADIGVTHTAAAREAAKRPWEV